MSKPKKTAPKRRASPTKYVTGEAAQKNFLEAMRGIVAVKKGKGPKAA